MIHIVIWSLIGFIMGAGIVWLADRLWLEKIKKRIQDTYTDTINALSIEKATYVERVEHSDAVLLEMKEVLGNKEKQLSDTLQDVSKLQTENTHLREKLTTQKSELEQIQKTFHSEFENLANKILEEKSRKFTEQNKENLGQLLLPLSEKIKDFQKRVEETYDKESKQRFSLEKEIQRLYELNELVTREANNLTNALKGESKTQGTWGEMILETILEKSGLIKGTHFSVQQSITTEEGKRFQPDVIVNLPDNKNMVIDSKVSLTAYERFYATDDKKERETALGLHIASIKNHIKELTGKNYQNLYAVKSPDFVLMFIPVEPAFGLAVLNDAELFYDAFNKNIVIVSPSTLLATLRTVGSIWRIENQNRNAITIAEQSGRLYDKFVSFVDDLQEIGKKIGDTQRSYDNALKKISTGTGNLIKRAEDIRRLGAKATKKMAENVVDESDETDIPLIEMDADA